VCQVPFSCLARPDSFSMVPRATGPVFMSCAPGLNFGGTEGVGSRFHVLRARTHFRRYEGVGSRFMFCPPGLVFGDNEGVGTRLHVLRSRTRFLLYRRSRFPFSCYARPDSFSAVPRASGPFLMFCAPGIFFGGSEGVGSIFNVLRAQTRFRWYRGRRFSFSCFAVPD
jgi:hypothetical protein